MLVSTEELAVLTARIGPVAALQQLKLRDLARETTSETLKLSLQTLRFSRAPCWLALRSSRCSRPVSGPWQRCNHSNSEIMDGELSEKISHRAPCWLALRSSLQHQCSCSMLVDTAKQICRSCNTNAAEASWAGDATAARKLHSSRSTANHGSNARCI